MVLFIRAERERRGWSMTRVTQLTGIAEPTLSLIERGLTPIYPGWRTRLKDAYGMGEELFDEVQEVNDEQR